MVAKPINRDSLFNYYTPIYGKGQLPKNLYNYNSNLKKTKLTLEEEFVVSNEYFLENLLLNGNVVYGDEISKYLQKVLNHILTSNNLKPDSFKVFLIKSSEFNAFATYDKKFFITVGTLAKLNSEAELASIMCHELTHIFKKHIRQSFFEIKDTENKKQNSKEGERESAFEAYNKFSKLKEKEADSLGLIELFKNTGYSKSAAKSLMKHLANSRFPIFEDLIKIDFFDEGNIFQIPQNQFTSDIIIYDNRNVEAKYDDQFLTHPNIGSRYSLINKIISDWPESHKNFIVTDSNTFYFYKEWMQFEAVWTYFTEGNNVDAVNSIYHLLHKYPDNNYLNEVLAQATFNQANLNHFFNNSNQFYPSYLPYAGETHQLNYFLNLGDPFWLTLLSIRTAYKNYQKSKSAQSLDVFKKAVYFLDKDLKIKQDLFKKELPPKTAGQFSIIDKNEREIGKKSANYNYSFVLADLFLDEYFQFVFDSIYSISLNSIIEQKLKSKEKISEIDTSKIIFFTPNYYSYTDAGYGDEKINFFKIKNNKGVLSSSLKKGAEKLELKYVYVNQYKDVESYNFQSYFNEMIRMYSKYPFSDFSYSNKRNVQKIIDTHQTKYAVYFGNYSKKFKKTKTFIVLNALGAIFPLTWPFTLSNLIRNDYESYFFFVVFDLEKNEVLYEFEKEYVMTEQEDVLKGLVWSQLIELKKHQN